MDRKPTAVDLFAGAGGMSLGFEQAGFHVKAAVEYDPIHAATYKFNFPQTTVFCKSVSEISSLEIRGQAGLYDEVDLVFGGPPCQGFSLIGKRALEDPRNRLVLEFVRVVSELQPKYFVLENVKGLTIGEHKRFLDELISEFRKVGFETKLPYRVLNAANYGVPQERHRLFILGARKGERLPDYPHDTHSSNPQTLLHFPNLVPTPTVWNAIGDLPDPEEHEELLERDWVMSAFGPATGFSKGLRQKPDSNGRELLSSSLRTVHTEKSIQRFALTRPGSVEPVSRFFKLDPNGLCNTIRAGTASDRGAFSAPRPIHPFSPRVITVREAARLHGFPDSFRFHVTKWHGFRQVGNSVPPPLARAVAQGVLRALDLSASKIHPLPYPMNRDGRLLNYDMSQAAEFFGVSRNVIPPRQRRDPEARYG